MTRAFASAARAALGALAIALASGSAGAETPKFSDLPAGTVTAPPATDTGKPRAIAARESVPGFFVAAPKQARSDHYVMVVGDADVAQNIKNGGSIEAPDDSACFADAQSGGFQRSSDDEEHEWTGSGLMWQANVWERTKDNPQGGVMMVHMEKVVAGAGAGAATLETTDAWIDPATHGARQAAHASLPLALVASTKVGGVKVWAARVTKKSGKDVVEFVLTRDAHRKKGEPEVVGAVLSIPQNTSGGIQNTMCGHARIALPAGPQSGESAIMVVPVVLPSLDAPGDPPKDDAKPAAVAASEAKAKPAPSKSFRRIRSAGQVPAGMVEKDIRTRDMQVHLSVSQTSRDKEPIVSVSFGWANRESTVRSAVPEPVGD